MSICGKLLDSLRREAEALPDVEELAESDAAHVCHRVASVFVADRGAAWSQTLSVPCRKVEHGTASPLPLIRETLGPTAPVFLVVTDGGPEPWTVFGGRAEQLCALLQQVRQCTYFFVDPVYTHVCFDNGVGTLVVAER